MRHLYSIFSASQMELIKWVKFRDQMPYSRIPRKEGLFFQVITNGSCIQRHKLLECVVKHYIQEKNMKKMFLKWKTEKSE